MKELRLKPHTVIMISGNDSDHFVNTYLIPFLESHSIKNKYFSLNAIKNQLSEKPAQVSKQGFILLEAGINAYSSYPVNTPIIIVDTNDMSVLEKMKTISLAEENNYLVEKFETSLPLSDIQISYEEINNYMIANYTKTCIVGDPHGCFDNLLEVVLDNKGIGYNKETNKLSIIDEANYVHHIIVGDFIDKGPQVREIVEFLYNNQEFFVFVKGNHENFVYEYLNKRIEKSPVNDELIANWFDSVLLFEEDEELRNKFFTLVELCYDFVISDDFIITHAPVKNKYLGKGDKKSIKKQRSFIYPKKIDYETEEEYLTARSEAFKFINDEGDVNAPYHIFGHTPVPEVIFLKNKICIDTGCVMGNLLSTISFEKGIAKPVIKSYKSTIEDNQKLDPYFTIDAFKSEAEYHVFEAIIAKTKEKIWQYFYIDKEGNNQHSKYYYTKEEAIAAYILYAPKKQ